MADSTTDLFGTPLAPDPRIALPALPPRAIPDVPLQRVQFCVELVGQFPLAAQSVSPLVAPQWYSHLGQPNLFTMRPGDSDWSRLVPSATDTYDSVMLAWDYLRDSGQLSGASASHLLHVSEQYASQVGRRAVSLTEVSDVDSISTALRQVEQQLDAGVSIAVMGRAPILERDLWILCANLGLTFSGSGSFDWVVPQHPQPVLSVTPIGETEAFSLGNVQRGMAQDGVTVGFRVATCPAVQAALDGAFRVADVIAQAVRGEAFDDSQRSLVPSVRNDMRRDLDNAIGMLTRGGLAPGGAEALKIFR